MTNMMKFLTTLLFVFSLSFCILGPETVSAAKCGSGLKGFAPGTVHKLDESSGKLTCEKIDTDEIKNMMNGEFGIQTYLYDFAKTFSWVGLGIAGMVITYAGFLYTLSEGNPEKVEKAKKLILIAGIGMLICLLAVIILDMIYGAFITKNT